MSPGGRGRAGEEQRPGHEVPTGAAMSPAPQVALLLRFLATLEEMVAGHQRLLGLLRREKELVVGGTVEALMPCLAEKDDALGRLARLERRRQEEFALLRAHFDPSASMARVTDLLSRVPEPYRADLASCQRRLDALTAIILDINQINGRLVGRVLKQIGSLLGVLTQLASPPASYGATGQLSEAPVGGRSFGEG